MPACALGCGPLPPALKRVGAYNLYRCYRCELFALGRASTHQEAPLILEREEFEDAFYALRTANYDTILGQLAALGTPSGSRVLDVGCSSGWFLRQATTLGYRCFGIEPDAFFYERARQRLSAEVSLTHGYFDRDLPADWNDFDVITFHDVFEHLPEPLQMMAACRRRLKPGGTLVLSLPAAEGFVYQLANGLDRAGVRGPLERVYQVHYPYPHLFYFDARSVSVLAERTGFSVAARLPLLSFSARGALHRAQMDKAAGMLGQLRNYASAAALVAFAGLQHMLPPDNVAFILRPQA